MHVSELIYGNNNFVTQARMLDVALILGQSWVVTQLFLQLGTPTSSLSINQFEVGGVTKRN